MCAYIFLHIEELLTSKRHSLRAWIHWIEFASYSEHSLWSNDEPHRFSVLTGTANLLGGFIIVVCLLPPFFLSFSSLSISLLSCDCVFMNWDWWGFIIVTFLSINYCRLQSLIMRVFSLRWLFPLSSSIFILCFLVVYSQCLPSPPNLVYFQKVMSYRMFKFLNRFKIHFQT